MTQRIVATLVLWIGVCGSGAHGAITAYWQQVTITPEAIANDPALANMQSWDLMVTTTGNWSAAGLRAWLPPGSFYYKHPMGGFKRPSPGAIAAFPALEFTPYVNTPNDNGLNNSNTNLTGGFENEPMSIGDPTAPQPGVFSVGWGDFFPDPPGIYQIARLTFPEIVYPNITGNNPRPVTTQVAPDALTFIPDIPEPTNMGLLATAILLGVRRRSAVRVRPTCERLEARRLLSFSASFPAGATLTPRTDANASNTSAVTEGEAVIAVSPSNPLKVAAFAVDWTNPDSVYHSSNGGLTGSYSSSVVPMPPGQTSGGDPAAAFDRAGNLYVAQLSNPGSNVSIAKSPDGGATWTLTKLIDNSAGADKPWIMTAPNPSLPSQDSVYVAWGGALARSDDGGMNFSALPSGGGGDSYRIVASPDGRRLFAAWWNRAVDVRFNWAQYDLQGQQLTWHTQQVIDSADFDLIHIPASPGSFILTAPSVAMDSNGATDRGFVTYTKKAAGEFDTDVWVAHKADVTASGAWTLTLLRDDTNSQFHSFVSTDPMTGVPYVSWLDTVNDPNNENVQPFMTVSLDGGVTWEPPTLVSDGDEVSRPYSPFSYGHYNGNTAFAGMGYDVWPSNAHLASSGPLDIYTDRVILSGHVVTVTGTSDADVYHVQMDASGEFVKIWENTSPVGTPTFTMHKDALAGLIFNLDTGTDVIFVAPAVLDYLTASGNFLDAGDSYMIVDYTGASPIMSVQSLLKSGYNDGEWDGMGIRSNTAAAAGNTAIGYVEATDLYSSFPATFAGQLVDSTTVLLKYTFYGDTDLNGNVNLTDFNRLAANFGLTGKRWFDGDFDYDGDVDLDDFNLLAGNFGSSGLGPGGGGGTYGYTVEDLLYHLLHGGHGLSP